MTTIGIISITILAIVFTPMLVIAGIVSLSLWEDIVRAVSKWWRRRRGSNK